MIATILAIVIISSSVACGLRCGYDCYNVSAKIAENVVIRLTSNSYPV